MANTKPVNFRVDSIFYKKTKEILADEMLTLSDIFTAALRKIATEPVDSKKLVNSELQETEFQVAFADFKKEILIGHQEIEQGKLTSLAGVRKEFVLE
ncbi:TPA: antitoxin [Streptococcus suis]